MSFNSPPSMAFQLQADPKQPSRAKKYEEKISQDELPANWMQLLSLFFGVIGLTLRYKLAAWLSLFSILSSFANSKRSDTDVKQTVTSSMFAIMGIFINYFGPVPPGMK